MALAAHFSFILTWFFIVLVTSVCGSPILSSTLHVLSPRSNLQVNDHSNGTITVFNPSTGNLIAQGSASDGGGTAFSATAIIWIVYCFVIGAPLAFGGIRLSRFTTGAGIGLATTACVWVAFVNTEPAKSLSELIITLIPFCLFLPGFVFGFFPFGRLAGVILIVIASGFSWGVRICLFRTDLLVRHVWGDWLIGAAFALVHVFIIPHYERIAVAVASASVGTFLLGLGIDLCVNRQSGMSFGLRLLFDRNEAHYLALVYKGWTPLTSTIIIDAVSLGCTLLFAYAQHRLFPSAVITPPREDYDHSYNTLSLPKTGHDRFKEKLRPISVVVPDFNSPPPTPSLQSGSDAALVSHRLSQLSVS